MEQSLHLEFVGNKAKGRISKRMFQESKATLLKKKLRHWCFPVNFAKFLRTPIFTEHLPAAASEYPASEIDERFSHVEDSNLSFSQT